MSPDGQGGQGHPSPPTLNAPPHSRQTAIARPGRTAGGIAVLLANGFARRLRLILQDLAALAGALVILAVVAALALTWRLGQGPLDADWLARRIEAAANDPARPIRLAIGHATLAWGGFADGPDQGLTLHLERARLQTPDGAQLAAAQDLAVTLSLSRLLAGALVPRTVAATGLDLGLVRRNGLVKLDLGGLVLEDDNDPTLAQVLEELARPPRRPGTRPPRPDLQHIEELERVRLTASTLRYTDPALPAPIRLDLASLDLRRRDRGGVTGAAAGRLVQGPLHATLALTAALAPDGGTQVKLAFAPVDAAAIAPGTSLDASLDSAIQGTAALTLDATLHPAAASVQLTATPGLFTLAGTRIGFDALAVEASATWDSALDRRGGWDLPQHLVLARARAVVRAPGGSWPSTVTLAAQLDRTPAALTGTAQATIDHLSFADIGALWPASLGGHIRPWLVPNVTAGTARDGAVTLAFTAHPDGSEPAITAIDGTLRGEDVTIWWLRPAPPIEQAQAVLTIRNPQSLDIAVPSARQGLGAGPPGITLTNGLLHFSGLDEHDQFLAMGADVAGSVPDLVTLLRSPALKLLSRSPLPLNNPAGSVTGHLAVSMPMKDVLPFELVRIQTSLRATNLRLAGIAAGRDIDHGTISLEANGDGMRATGRANVANIPSDLTLDLDFRPGGPAQLLQQIQASAQLTPRQLAAAGFDPGTAMPGGSARLTARYVQRRDGAATIQLNADLAAAALALPGWTKPPGQPGTFAARIQLQNDRLTAVDTVHAAAPGFALDGRLDLRDGRPTSAILDLLQLGSTQASGQVVLPSTPNDPVRVDLHGPMLDLAPLLETSKPSSDRSAPWVADLRFDRVRISGKPAAPPLAGLVAHAENDGRRLSALTLTSSGPERLRASIRLEGRPEARNRRLAVEAVDGGALLDGLGVLSTLQGGHLRLDALFDDARPASPLAGTLELTEFRLRDAPVLGKLLQAATIYGVVDALRGPGLVFSDLVLPFRYDAGVLTLADARAFSASLGLTAHGRIDTARKTLDVQGTVVPAYVLNSALGRIPLVGRLFSNERGGGLVAVDYAVRGLLADPAIRVNPLSALTPGFLRGLFHIFD